MNARGIVAVLLMGASPAFAGGTSLVPEYGPITLATRPPSQAEQELRAEQAKHPGQHWICTAMDWYCLDGFWEADEVSEWRNRQAIDGTVAAMRAADAKAEKARLAAIEAAPFRAAAEFPSELEHAVSQSPLTASTSWTVSGQLATSGLTSATLPAPVPVGDVLQRIEAIEGALAALKAR